MYSLNEELRRHIGEIYDGSFWKPISALYNRDGEAFEIFKFEETVEFDGKNYWVICIEKWNYDPEDVDVLLDTEEIYFKVIHL